ncbi:hypothetical protein C5S35_06020 [Candidatus Methanophagaceae archaeon]|nr:hypothetical protein C5S35_06020 [Methanophagales archaeon]
MKRNKTKGGYTLYTYAMKKAKTELIDRGFPKKIADKYTNLQLFTTDFTPIISTRRIIPRMRWLELIYALPVVLRREILNSFKKTKNVFTSVKQIWNIFVRFEFPLSRYEYITTRSHRFSREIMKMQDSRFKIQVKPVSGILYPVSYPYAHLERETLLNGQKIFSQLKQSSMELAQPVSPESSTSRIETEKESAVTNYQMPVFTTLLSTVSHRPSSVSQKNLETYIPPGPSDITTPLFSYYSFKPTLFLSRKTVPVMPRGASLIAQKSDTVYRPYGHLERETFESGQKIISYFKSSLMELAQPVSRETTRIEPEKELAVKNYQLPVATPQPPVVSHEPSAVRYEDLATYILTSTSDFIAPLFRYYPFKPTFFLSPKTGPVKQREVPLNLQKSDAFYRPYAHLERETFESVQKIISYFKSSSMELAQPVSRETTRIEPEKESAVTNYQLPVVTHQPPVVEADQQFKIGHKIKADNALNLKRRNIFGGKTNCETASLIHKPASVSTNSLEKTSIFSRAKEFITPLFSYYSAQKIKTDVGEKAIYDILPYFNFRNNKQMHTSEVEKAPIYHTYPEIEHVTSTHVEIKERVIEKGEESKQPHATPQLPGIDVNRLADEVYQMMERKLRIEKERRGLYG